MYASLSLEKLSLGVILSLEVPANMLFKSSTKPSAALAMTIMVSKDLESIMKANLASPSIIVFGKNEISPIGELLEAVALVEAAGTLDLLDVEVASDVVLLEKSVATADDVLGSVSTMEELAEVKNSFEVDKVLLLYIGAMIGVAVDVISSVEVAAELDGVALVEVTTELDEVSLLVTVELDEVALVEVTTELDEVSLLMTVVLDEDALVEVATELDEVSLETAMELDEVSSLEVTAELDGVTLEEVTTELVGATLEEVTTELDELSLEVAAELDKATLLEEAAELDEVALLDVTTLVEDVGLTELED